MRQYAVIWCLLLLIPLILILTSLSITNEHYDRAISNVAAARCLQDEYISKIDAEMWLIVSGQKPVSDNQARELIVELQKLE